MLKKVTGYESELPREAFACETNATGSLRTLFQEIKTITPEYIPHLIWSLEDNCKLFYFFKKRPKTCWKTTNNDKPSKNVFALCHMMEIKKTTKKNIVYRNNKISVTSTPTFCDFISLVFNDSITFSNPSAVSVAFSSF